MRRIHALFLFLVSVPGFAASEGTVKLDLERALSLAREHNPLIRAARQGVGEARGDLTGARVFLRNNPIASIAYGRRSSQGSEPEQTDSEVALSQELEIAGQRRHRIASASARVEAAEARAMEVERRILAAVSAAFFDAVLAAEWLRLAEGNTMLAQELLEISRVRVDKGASPPLELNASRIRLALARGQEAEARSAKSRTGLVLLSLTGLDSGSALELEGDIPPVGDVPDLDFLLEQASHRPDVTAAQADLRAAEGELNVADAERFPSPVVGGFVAQDEGDSIVSGTLSIGLPLFQRNQGERQRTRAALQRSHEELAAVQLEVDREVRELFSEYVKARETLTYYDEEVVKAMDENVGLLRLMFEAGKVGYTDVALLQRERIETSLALLRARAEVATAAFNLRGAAGLPLLATAPGGGR